MPDRVSTSCQEDQHLWTKSRKGGSTYSHEAEGIYHVHTGSNVVRTKQGRHIESKFPGMKEGKSSDVENVSSDDSDDSAEFSIESSSSSEDTSSDKGSESSETETED